MKTWIRELLCAYWLLMRGGLHMYWRLRKNADEDLVVCVIRVDEGMIVHVVAVAQGIVLYIMVMDRGKDEGMFVCSCCGR